MRLIQATTLALGLLDLAIAQLSPPIYCICPNGLICAGKTPQCTPDRTNGTQATCCASGQMAIKGNCVDADSQLCSDGETICSGADSQCTVDTEGKIICCARGQIASKGKCLNAGSQMCSDGKTTCSGSKSECTVDITVWGDNSGGASSKQVCCAPGQKSINGRCYPRKAKVMPCYSGVCDWGQNYYCAWNAGNADSRCCKLNEYYAGNACVRKP